MSELLLVVTDPASATDLWLRIKVITLIPKSPMYPSPVPSMKPLRLASPRDILRIGLVATCGFRHSPIFDWERPYHEKYPEDTLLSLRQAFASVIKSPEYAVLVALDKYEPDEAKKSKAIIPPNNGAKIPAEGDEVIVGVACWKLEPGSKRIGKFQNETGNGLRSNQRSC